MASSVNGYSMGLSLTISEDNNINPMSSTEYDERSSLQDNLCTELDSVSSSTYKGSLKNGGLSSGEKTVNAKKPFSPQLNSNRKYKRKRRKNVDLLELPEKRIRTRLDMNPAKRSLKSTYSKRTKKRKINLKSSKKTKHHKKQHASSDNSHISHSDNSDSFAKDHRVISPNRNGNSSVQYSLENSLCYSSHDLTNGSSAVKQNFDGDKNDFVNGTIKVDSPKASPEKNTFDDNSDSLAATSMKQALEKKLKKIIDSPDSKAVPATNLITTLSEKLSSKLANAFTRRSPSKSELHNDGIVEETSPVKSVSRSMSGSSSKKSSLLQSLKKKGSVFSSLTHDWNVSPKTSVSDALYLSSETESKDLPFQREHLKESPTNHLKLKPRSHSLLPRDACLLKRQNSNVYDPKQGTITITKKYNYINFVDDTPSVSTDNSGEQDEPFDQLEDIVKSPKKSSSPNSSLQKSLSLPLAEQNGDYGFRLNKNTTFDSEGLQYSPKAESDHSLSSKESKIFKPGSLDKLLSSFKKRTKTKEVESLIQDSKLKKYQKCRLRSKVKKKKTECEMLLASLSETKDPLPANPKRKRTESKALTEKAVGVNKVNGVQNNLSANESSPSSVNSQKNSNLAVVVQHNSLSPQSSVSSIKSKSAKNAKKLSKIIKKDSALSAKKKIKDKKAKSSVKPTTPLIAKRKNAIKVQLNLEKKKKQKQLANSKENSVGKSVYIFAFVFIKYF